MNITKKYIKKNICNGLIFIFNKLPMNKENIGKFVRYFHYILPLLLILSFIIIKKKNFIFMYLILTFGVVTQIVFDTCLLTDVEEHYTNNNKESVIVVALNKLNINPCKKNKRRITFIVTFLTLITIYFIVRCRKTGKLFSKYN